MNFIDEAGAYVYFFTSRNSLDYQFINIFEYGLRLQYLSKMLPLESSIKELIEKEIFFLPTNFDKNSFFAEENIEASNFSSNFNTKQESADYSTNNDDKCIEFLTPSKGVLKEKWIFHPYDDDYYPSIPHGHLDKNEKIKLDAYRGFTYDTKSNNKQLKRETKRYIIGLWNDPKFKIMAINAIDYYQSHFTNFKWRVKNYRRLPKFK